MIFLKLLVTKIDNAQPMNIVVGTCGKIDLSNFKILRSSTRTRERLRS